jgi:methionyl aminopeptidase
LSPEVLGSLREAGRVASAAREYGARLIVAGARVRDVCQAVDEEICNRGGSPAFPTQSSRNELAAHYCPGPEDETAYARGDLAKLDVGVHVDGWVVDTATTVNVGDRPENRPYVEAARSALEGALAVLAPGIEVRRLAQAIEETVARYGLRPMRNLCGHGVGRYTVHCPPPIPNVADQSGAERLPVGAVFAIEPFATDGLGLVAERGPAEVFRLDPRRDAAGIPGDGAVLEAIRAFRGLPFARRQLAAFPRAAIEATLEVLANRRLLHAYPPLAESTGGRVAQAEHTVYLSPDGPVVLTR